MSFLDPIRDFLGIRSIDFDLPPLEDQLAAIRSQSNFRPWRAASIREALGVPAIYRAVSLIANTTGALTLEAYRRGRRLDDGDRPRLIVRPDPFTTPRDFYRDTAWNMATRGEAWWWVAKRDFDDIPLSLINVPPSEVRV
jgi:phage portal protein BeeE